MNKMLLRLIAISLFLVAGTSVAGSFNKSSLVWKKCKRCHAVNEVGEIARVEDLRTTPEEWTVIIDRMYRLYGMRMKKGEMATLLKELCATQILTPEEAGRVAYIDLFNNPQVIETPGDEEEEQLFATCARCHSAGKIFSYRMTESAWQKLRDFHIYIDPAIMAQMREMHWRDEADTALKGLARKLPYDRAWAGSGESPAGDWLMLGFEPGKGNYRGNATLKSLGDDEYILKGALSFHDGTFETFSGEATLYGDYALRTRTRQNGSATMGAFRFLDGTISGEHHHHAPNFRTSSSTWFPVSGKSQALRITPDYLLSGEQTTVLIEGINLPEITAGDIVVSDDQVDIEQARTTSPETIEIVLTYRGVNHGKLGMNMRSLEAPPIKLAPHIDYLGMSPELGRARVNGGINYPAEGVQFQAYAYSFGADADDPSDDYLLGPVAATFSLSEEKTRPKDDDLTYIGAIEADGTYLPSGDYNPIPAREYGGEATGLVKVLAKYTRGQIDYATEGQLAVTVPDYIQRLK